MKVILLETIEKVGNVGEIVEVSEGYGRNYLLPKKLAMIATPQAEIEIQKKMAELKAQEEAKQAELSKFAASLAEITLTIPAKAGEEGKLFGSVTSADITELLTEKAKTEIEKSQLELPEPIKAVGDYEIPVTLGHGIHATVKVSVVPEGEEKKTKKEKAEKIEEEKPTKK